MATQAVKIIDIERSFIPMDPMSFPESMQATGGEDTPEARIPSIVYDGTNFMPTAYGYMSYFGINSLLDIDPLVQTATPFSVINTDELFIVQTDTLSNVLVALTDDGIWTKDATITGAWAHIVTLTAPDAGSHLNWTRCVIGNNVYMYRATNDVAYQMNADNSWVPTAFTPDFLNMAGQLGIFKAGARLAFWDADNSISWADPDDVTSFTPDLETGANGGTIFSQIVGKVVACRQHGDGFIIYCTKSIIWARRTADANFFFAGTAIFTENGISYLEESVHGQPDTIHFAYTTFGMVRITNGQAEYILPEIFTYLKEARNPVYLKLLQGRYLFLEIIDQSYITGIPNFSTEDIPGGTITFKSGSYAVEHIEQNSCKALRAVEGSQESIYLFNQYGFTAYNQATTPGSVPIWEDHLSSIIAPSDLASFKTFADASNIGGYFTSTGFAAGGLTTTATGTEYFIPTKSPDTIGSFAATDTVEPNTNSFWDKQDLLWFYERLFMQGWLDAIANQPHPNSVEVVTTGSTLTSEHVEQTFGPYIDMSYFSEQNKYYGSSDTSAWLQRSLTKGISVHCSIDVDVDGGSIGNPSNSTQFATMMGNPLLPGSGGALDNLVHDFVDSLDLATPLPALSTGSLGVFVQVVYTSGGTTGLCGGGSCTIAAVCHVSQPSGTIQDTLGQCTICNSDHKVVQAARFSFGGSGIPSDVNQYTVTKIFGTPEFRPFNYATCLYKELGYTKIKGHGHYSADGTFTVDDATPEAAGYTDICLSDPVPNKKKQNYFNDVAIPDGQAQGCVGGPVVISSSLFSYPDQVLTIPPGSFLLQSGSIEPIYPTFSGAFVYDLQYKKWGKCSVPHKLLLNYSPINSQAGDKPVPYDIFSVNAGCLLEDGTIAIFDKFPSDSRIVIGKIGYYRKGFTDCEEVRLQFRDPATGSITVEGSLDSKLINPAISKTYSYENVHSFQQGFALAARWFNLIISGIFDLKNLDFAGTKKGKR